MPTSNTPPQQRKRMTFARALALLGQPDAKLVKQHSADGDPRFEIWPRGGRVSDPIAQALLRRSDVQPYDSGLLPGHPQSWRLGNWRKWGAL
jgi:hypothetical protein